MLKSNLIQFCEEWLDADTNRTQAQLASESGISTSQLSRLMNSNQCRLDLSTAYKLWTVIHFDIRELLTLESGDE